MTEAAQAAPMTTVPGLLSWIERQFPVGGPTATRLSVTGEPYVRIGHSYAMPTTRGVVDEGEAEELGFDEATACMAAASAFRNYAEDRPGVLYWRQKPYLEWTPNKRRCRVYMRLLISEKPPIGCAP